MRIAIIDCGTNTFNLLVADAEREGWKLVFENKIPVKLGAGGFEHNEIIPSRFTRGLDALFCHSRNLLNYDVEKIFAFATSAVRESRNGKDFIQQAHELTGIEIKAIDGDEEAELIYKGIRQTIDIGSHPALIMDIGGGSTEFIIADNSTIFWKKSYLLGVSRLFDLVKPSDRINHSEIHQLRALLDRELVDLRTALEKYNCHRLIGSSGSFDTLFALYRDLASGMDNSLAPDLSNDIPIQIFPSIHSWLLGSTFEERLKHPAIPSVRAEYMPLASYLIKYVLETKSIHQLTHSAYALKEGAIQTLIEKMDWPAPVIEEEKPEDYMAE